MTYTSWGEEVIQLHLTLADAYDLLNALGKLEEDDPTDHIYRGLIKSVAAIVPRRA